MGTPNLDFLREQVDALKRLLDDPQPGLATWSKMYGDRMQALVDFWNADKDEVPMAGHVESGNHGDPRVRALIINLNDALCSWERETGRESVLIIREQGGFVHRSVSGKPVPPVARGLSDDVIIRSVL
jgi:hypothetical protein